jgi:hypothetical protein
VLDLATARPLAVRALLRLDEKPGFEGEAMKQVQPRETMPLWVWLAIAILGMVAVAYFAGYWMVGEIVSHKK